MRSFLMLVSWIRFCLYAGLAAAAVMVLAGLGLVVHTAGDLPRLPSPLSRIIETPQTQIFAANGQTLVTLGERKTIPLDMVSKDFINAILAVEDHRFFEHHGINKLRTVKGLYLTLFKGKVQGASTITQQLAKNLFFTFEQTYTRKFKELLVALQIEASNSKPQILHAYINQIHFGAGAQGIERAAQTFFGKSALELSLSEAALLAGLPKSPTRYNPLRYYERSLQRRNVVLKRMVQTGFVTELEAEHARAERPVLSQSHSDSRTGSYFLDALINRLIKQYGEDVVYHGGIKVYSTLDPRLQLLAREAVQKGLDRLDTLMGLTDKDAMHPQAALVAIDSGSGAVKAMVGGKDYYASEFNRAMNSRRQPGSGFKPFLYYSAFHDLGFHPATVMTDKRVRIAVKGASDWEPANFGKTFHGDMILKQALTRSVNTIAAQLVEQTGPGAVIRTARACGIKSPINDVFSVALGTSEVTPFEMASAYSVFSTLGVRHEPFLIWRVEDAFGRIIFEQIVQEKRVLNPATCYQVVDMMKSVIDTGSGRSIRALGFDRPAAGKTGTTDSYNDAWFTGFTPTLSTSVWTGFDKKQRLVDVHGNGITGGRAAAPIWADFMSGALRSEPVRDFPIPDDIRFMTVDQVTGCPPVTLEPDPLEPAVPGSPPEAVQPAGPVMKVPLKSGQHPCAEETP